MQRQPVRSWPSQLNRVSRTRSGVGRRPGLSDTLSLVRFHRPPMMRISWLCTARGLWTRLGLLEGEAFLVALVLMGIA